MLNPSALIRDGKPVGEAIASAAAQGDDQALAQALGQATANAEIAALAVIAGERAAGAEPALGAAMLRHLGADGAAGKAVAWALGRFPVESAILAAIPVGGLDARENGFHALAALAARGAASPGLAEAATALVRAEIDRAKAGRTGLAEHGCRVLAVLGAPGLSELIQQVIESDRFCDRFELQRQRKAVQDGGRDSETVKALNAPWTVALADLLYQEPKPAPAPAAKAAPAPVGKSAGRNPGSASAAGPGGAGARPGSPTFKKPPAGFMPPPEPSPAGEDADDELDDAADGALPADGKPAQPIDWPAFAASPEAQALSAPHQKLIAQLGPLLEQLAPRAIQAALADLAGQELVALLLQVMPQALPPQHVQAALSPQALNGYQALARYLARTGVATHGDELVQGVKMVRKQLADQMRRSGMLGGPDYSDPDDAKPAKP